MGIVRVISTTPPLSGEGRQAVLGRTIHHSISLSLVATILAVSGLVKSCLGLTRIFLTRIVLTTQALTILALTELIFTFLTGCLGEAVGTQGRRV